MESFMSRWEVVAAAGTCIHMGLQVGEEEETCRRRDYAAAVETSTPDVVVESEADTHKELGYNVVLVGVCKPGVLVGVCKPVVLVGVCKPVVAVGERCTCKPEDVQVKGVRVVAAAVAVPVACRSKQDVWEKSIRSAPPHTVESRLGTLVSTKQWQLETPLLSCLIASYMR